MIERSGKKVKAHSHMRSLLGYGATDWGAAILVLSVSLAILQLPLAFGQPDSDADNFATANPSHGGQTKQGLPDAKAPPVQRSNTATKPQTERHQEQLLRYDVGPTLPASQLPRAFYNSKDLLPHSG